MKICFILASILSCFQPIFNCVVKYYGYNLPGKPGTLFDIAYLGTHILEKLQFVYVGYFLFWRMLVVLHF